ncbi:MAG: hypothetical protein GSR80_000644 [Desulfurococcales archaeon]|nr:hypothetical protein [Desulfurococcales archaeon]
MEACGLGNRKGVVVILDSNTLMMMAGGLVAPSTIAEALEASYILVAPTAVKAELERLAAGHPRTATRRLAGTALRLAGSLGVRWLEALSNDADDAIEELARALRGEGCRVIVATSDRALRRRLRRLGIPTLYYRESEGRLEAEWAPL